MTGGRIVHLDEHVGRVISSLFPTDDEAYLLCLTSQQLSIVRQFVFPYAHWRTRLVDSVQDDVFRTADDVAWEAYHQEVEDLEDSLEGCSMPCSDIREGLEAIAAALAAMNTCNTTVNCGGSSGAGVGNALLPYDPEELLPPDPITEPPESGPPPEGFDTWEMYYTHKCQAAHAVWQMLRNTIVQLTTLQGVFLTMESVVPVVLMIAGIVTLTPLGIVLVATALVGISVLTLFGFEKMSQMVDYLDTNKEDIICALYTSSSADDALDFLADAMEDAIEAIEWGVVLLPLGPAIAELLGTIMSQVITTNLVNVLFQLVEDVTLPDVECTCSGEATAWPFTLGVEGWVYEESVDDGVETDHGWKDTGGDPDPGSDPGHLWTTVEKASGALAADTSWQYYFSPGNRPIATAGRTFSCRIGMATGDQVTCNVALIYTDLTSDDNIFSGAPGWNSYDINPSAPNYGKYIKELYVKFSVGNTTELRDFALDTCELDAA